MGSAIMGCEAGHNEDEGEECPAGDEWQSNKLIPAELRELQKDMEDLLSMPSDESYADIAITLQASGGRQKVVHAHKSILGARSHYFAAMVSLNDLRLEEGGEGKDMPSMMDTLVVNVDRVPLGVAADVIKYLYTGIVAVRPECVANLLLLSDQWCLDELRIIVLHQLRNRMCRKFRKPEGSTAKDVATRVMQVLQLCGAALHFGLPDTNGAIYELRKDCVSWLSQWGTKCWNLKEFALLPQAIHQEIQDHFLSQITPENCTDLFTNCHQILATLPTIAWATPVKNITTALRSKLGDFMLANFGKVSKARSFKKIMSGGWHRERAHEICAVLMKKMTPENIIDVVIALNTLEHQDAHRDGKEITPFVELDTQARSYALRHIMWVMRSDKYNAMQPDARTKFVTSVEKAGIKEKEENVAKDGRAKGGEFFVVFDEGQSSTQALKRCPLKERTPQTRRRASMDSLPVMQVFGSKSVDLTGGPRQRTRARRPSSSSCSDRGGGWDNLFASGPIHSRSGSWNFGFDQVSIPQETRVLRRKGSKQSKDIPRPPKVDQFSGQCFFGTSRIPKPPPPP